MQAAGLRPENHPPLGEIPVRPPVVTRSTLEPLRGVHRGVHHMSTQDTPAHPARIAKPNRLGHAVSDGRTWDRTRKDPN